jgi:hypothetical protein
LIDELTKQKAQQPWGGSANLSYLEYYTVIRGAKSSGFLFSNKTLILIVFPSILLYTLVCCQKMYSKNKGKWCVAIGQQPPRISYPIYKTYGIPEYPVE